MKPGNPPLQSTRVLDQLRERIRYRHYSLSTEQVYVYWVRFFIRWSARDGQTLHPRELGQKRRIPGVLTKGEVAGRPACAHGRSNRTDRALAVWHRADFYLSNTIANY